MERCPRGRRSTIGNRVYLKRVSWVQIPLSPPSKTRDEPVSCFYLQMWVGKPVCFSKLGALVWLAKPGESEHLCSCTLIMLSHLQAISTIDTWLVWDTLSLYTLSATYNLIRTPRSDWVIFLFYFTCLQPFIANFKNFNHLPKSS